MVNSSVLFNNTFVRRRRRRDKLRLSNPAGATIGLCICSSAALYLVFLWKIQAMLEANHQSTSSAWKMFPSMQLPARQPALSTSVKNPAIPEAFGMKATPPPPTFDKYIIFEKHENGQGVGNIMDGLLAAHLLGREFSRTVCVSLDFTDFHRYFEPSHPTAVQTCPTVLQQLPEKDVHNQLHLMNYESPPDECKLQEKLHSDMKILYFNGNTYPRWPLIPDNFFFRNYRPTKALLESLPYSAAPETVVHLRMPDSELSDMRKGTDEYSLDALGQLLANHTSPVWLVTNRVEWFDKFERVFGWKHPDWDEVVHSALKKSWGTRHEGLPHGVYVDAHDENHDRQMMQLWVDWYTILTAKMVYHTSSDFSFSAIHWMNIPSKCLDGYNFLTQTIVLQEESWRADGERAPLVERSPEGAGRWEIQNCAGLHYHQIGHH